MSNTNIYGITVRSRNFFFENFANTDVLLIFEFVQKGATEKLAFFAYTSKQRCSYLYCNSLFACFLFFFQSCCFRTYIATRIRHRRKGKKQNRPPTPHDRVRSMRSRLCCMRFLDPSRRTRNTLCSRCCFLLFFFFW